MQHTTTTINLQNQSNTSILKNDHDDQWAAIWDVNDWAIVWAITMDVYYVMKDHELL
jgi:hypothetical protein